MINDIVIDESKMQKVAKLIEDAIILMEDTKISNEVKQTKLLDMQSQICQISNKDNIDIFSFYEYWSYTSLEDLAKRMLYPTPCKMNLSDGELRTIVKNLCDCYYNEVESEYWLEVLAIETNIIDVSDYIFFPQNVGMHKNAGFEEIIEKILSDKGKGVILL